MHVARLTRTVAFRAMHRYYRPDWTPQQNEKTFGACAAAPGHEHLYHCLVTVAGAVAEDTGMVMDLAALDRILEEEISHRFDGRHINHEVPEFGFGKTVPTGEALAVFVWEKIAPRLPPEVTLESVRVREDPMLESEYRGGR